MISFWFGLMMGRVSPASMAAARKALVTSIRFGRPKEILLTPSTVFSPSSSRTRRTAFRVSFACSCWAETVSVRQSIQTSSLGIPRARARFRIFRAMATRFSAVSGMPFSSRVSPTTAAPYFFTRGSTVERLSSFPFTEFTAAFPWYTRRAASSASGLVVSSCSGRSTALWMACTTRGSMLTSSTPGYPTFTSSRSAPASAWPMASSTT